MWKCASCTSTWLILYRKKRLWLDEMPHFMYRMHAEARKNTKNLTEKEIILFSDKGVRYTVPSVIRLDHMPEELTVRFRVGGVYKNCYISCYLDRERIIHRKRPVIAPGEMEQIKLTREQIMKNSSLQKITLKIEEA